MGHEEAFTKAFILSEKRARFLQYLANSKRRKEVLVQLSHRLPFIPAFGKEVPGAQDFPDELEKLLRAKGAGPVCHVIAGGLKADGRELPLKEALTLICLQEHGAILSCLPGQLAYYRPAPPGPGILLEKPPR
jgi:hypothetical protein